jgi:hypothetical protein
MLELRTSLNPSAIPVFRRGLKSQQVSGLVTRTIDLDLFNKTKKDGKAHLHTRSWFMAQRMELA